MRIGNLFWRLGLDDKGLKKDAAKAGKDAGQAAGAEASKGLTGGLKKALSGGGMKQGLLQGLGLGAALTGVGALTAGLSALTDGIFKSIGAASDQREALALNEQVFKDSSDTIEEWADTAAESFGESKKNAVNFAAGFGNTLKSAGLAMDELSSKSIELTERAADIGSAFNASGEEVATAIKSGLVGESEPLRRFGVLLNEAKVNAKGVELGLVKVGQKMTEGQKVLARYQIILDETSESAGMFGRDTESLADVQKALNAQMEDLSAEIGVTLMPLMVEFAKFTSEDLVPALKDFIDTVKDAEPLWAALAAAIQASDGPLGDVQGTAEELGDAILIARDRFGVASTSIVEKSRLMALEFDKTDEAAGGLDRGLEDIIAELEAAKDPMDKLTDALAAFYDEIIENTYEPEQLRLRLQELNGELKTEKQRLEELQEIKDPTAEQRADIIDTTIKVSELNEDIDKTKVKIGLLDGASLKELRATFRTLKKNGVDPLSAEMEHIWNLIRKAYKTVTSINPPGAPTGGAKKKHGGGAITGVSGTEVPITGKVGEFVIPNMSNGVTGADLAAAIVSGDAGPAGGKTIHVNLLDRMGAQSPRDISDGLRMLGERGYL